MLSSYLNQVAEYKPCTGTDGRGQPSYGPPVILACRRQNKIQNVLTATGQTVKTQHIYYVEKAVKEGDKLDGNIIMGVSEWTELDGESMGYKAVVCLAKGITFKLNDKELNKQLKKAFSANPKETVKAVMDCTLDLAANSAKRAPIESGDLRNNCVADVNGIKVYEKQSGLGASAIPSLKAIGDIGYSLPYALRQHEDLSLPHNRTDGYRRSDGTTVNLVAGGEAKFLERPFEERLPRYIKRMEKIVERSIK